MYEKYEKWGEPAIYVKKYVKYFTYFLYNIKIYNKSEILKKYVK